MVDGATDHTDVRDFCQILTTAWHPFLAQFSRVDGTSDALYAMELALQLEKFVYRKLKVLHSLGEECNDPEFTDRIEGYLTEQVSSIKQIASYVAQIRRLGNGHGVWHLDKELEAAQA